MKKKLLHRISYYLKRLSFIIFIISINLSINAQTGVFYYPDKASTNNNNKIVDLIELDNSELCLLGKLTDKDYKNPSPFCLRIDKNGRKLSQKALNVESLYEVNKLVYLPNKNIKVYGSQQVDGKYNPFNINIDKTGIEKKSDYSYTIYSTLIGDAMQSDDDELVLIETKLGKSERYSISFHKINVENNNKIWSKTIESTNNEEANQVFVTREGYILVLGKRYNDDLSEYLPILYKYTSSGELVWSEEINVPKNFYNQSVCTDKKDNIYYICGYTKETTGKSETRIIKFTPDKIKVQALSLENFSANGIIAMSNGEFLIYGSNLKVHEGHVITKGKLVIMDRNMIIKKEHELSIQDKPDSEYPSEVMKKLPTSSDLLTGLQLRDGRIALAGRVFMPTSKTSKQINTARHNSALLVITDKYGNFR